MKGIKKYIKLTDGRILEVITDSNTQPDNVPAYVQYPYYDVFKKEQIVATADTKEELEVK